MLDFSVLQFTILKFVCYDDGDDDGFENDRGDLVCAFVS